MSNVNCHPSSGNGRGEQKCLKFSSFFFFCCKFGLKLLLKCYLMAESECLVRTDLLIGCITALQCPSIVVKFFIVPITALLFVRILIVKVGVYTFNFLRPFTLISFFFLFLMNIFHISFCLFLAYCQKNCFTF